MAQHAQNRQQAKGWFLTWPKCPVKKEDALYGRFKIINGDEFKGEDGYFDWELVIDN